ncbi:MAG: ribonuclease HI [Acidobacteriota bacterium]|nr:ribonuclease HI [Acidobacteriota bacterium]MDH3524588.1 ribonuclease HI [Acidobacteriota bacterium]
MAKFRCEVCGSAFDVPQAALDKYPGWRPRFCRDHSPQHRTGGARKGAAKGAGATRSTAARRGHPAPGKREENLTLAEVLARYEEGPRSGVFTDGSATPNPGPGGWGVVWVENGEVRGERHGHEARTTNNRMELTALIAAYELLPADAKVKVHTDSRLCVDTITKWAPAWERNGWKRKGQPLKNLDLVRPLLALYRAHPGCPLEWIAAHSGQRWNEYADSLATAWMRAEL